MDAVVSQSKKNAEPVLKDSLYCFALLLTDFGKSLVKHRGAERPATGRGRAANVVP